MEAENRQLRERIHQLEAELASTKQELARTKDILKFRYHHNERDEEDDALFQAILETFGAHNPKSLHTPASTFATMDFGHAGTHARTNTLIRRQKDEKDEQILNEIWRKNSAEPPSLGDAFSNFTSMSIVDETQSFGAFASFLPQTGNEVQDENIYEDNNRPRNNTSVVRFSVDNTIDGTNTNINLNTFNTTTDMETDAIEIKNDIIDENIINSSNNNNNNNTNNSNSTVDPNNITLNTIEEVIVTITNDKARDSSVNLYDVDELNETINDNINNDIDMNSNNINEQDFSFHARKATASENIMIETQMDEYRNQISFWREAYVSLMSSKMELINATAKEQQKLRNIIAKLSKSMNNYNDRIDSNNNNKNNNGSNSNRNRKPSDKSVYGAVL